MTMQFLSLGGPWAKRVMCFPRLWTNCTAQMCIVSGCPVNTPRRFSGILSDVGCHELQLFCHCEVCYCEVEDEDAAGGVFPWLSAVPPSSFPIDIVIEVFSFFELLILSLKFVMFWTYRSQRSLRFRQVSVFFFKALFYCNGKFWSLSERLMRPISMQTQNPVFRILNSLSFCSRAVMPFQSDPVVKHDLLFTNIVLCKRISVFFLCIPSCENRRMAPMFLLSCFLKHLPRLERHYLSFRDTVFWFSTGILLNDKARDRSTVAIVLLGGCKTSRILPVSSATTTNHPDFPQGISIRT